MSLNFFYLLTFRQVFHWSFDIKEAKQLYGCSEPLKT